MIETIFNLAKENFWLVVALSIWTSFITFVSVSREDFKDSKPVSFLGKIYLYSFFWVLSFCCIIALCCGLTYAGKAASGAYKYAASWVEPKRSPNPLLRRPSNTVSNADIKRELQALRWQNEDLSRQVQNLQWEVQRSNY